MQQNATIDGLDQLAALLNRGHFAADVRDALDELRRALIEHQQAHGGKPKASFTVKFSFQLGTNQDLIIGGSYSAKPPDPPDATGIAFLTDQGELTLHSPLLTQAHEVRDPSDGTREIRAVE